MANKQVPSSKPTIQALVSKGLRALLEADATKNDNSLSAEVGRILELYKDPNHFLIRVPEKIKEQIEEEAQNENRSTENLIEWIIIKYYQKKE